MKSDIEKAIAELIASRKEHAIKGLNWKALRDEGRRGVQFITPQDRHFMHQALELAKKAQDQGEVPVGAIIVLDDKVVGQGWNQPISSQDSTAHAEIMALREAGKTLNNYRLINTTLYVTLEPCMMCVGAMVHARIQRLVFGAFDPKTGAVESVLQLLDTGKLNHQIQWVGGCVGEACGGILREFFQRLRQNS